MQLVDWVTVAAQIVNFLILVALLKYFLFGRVVAAIDQREQRIREQSDEAERKQAQAARHLNEAKEKSSLIDRKRDEMLAEVRHDIDRYRHDLTARARKDVDELKRRWEQSLRDDSMAFLAELRRRIAREAFAVARHILSELSDADLETRIVRKFLQQLQTLDGNENEKITASLKRVSNTVRVRSAFSLSDDLRDLIEDALRHRLTDNVVVHFESTADFDCGIELQVDDRKLAWNVSDCLDALQQHVISAMDQLMDTAARERPDSDNESRENEPTHRHHDPAIRS